MRRQRDVEQHYGHALSDEYRVKLYKIDTAGNWVDGGTGNVHFELVHAHGHVDIEDSAICSLWSNSLPPPSSPPRPAPAAPSLAEIQLHIVGVRARIGDFCSSLSLSAAVVDETKADALRQSTGNATYACAGQAR